MPALTLRLPDSVHKKVKGLAKRDGISINQFLSSAAAEKMSSMLTVDYLEREAAMASRSRFRKVLKKVPRIKPADTDQLP